MRWLHIITKNQNVFQVMTNAAKVVDNYTSIFAASHVFNDFVDASTFKRRTRKAFVSKRSSL